MGERLLIGRDYFNDIGMEVLLWPGNSPDMNPIEGIWYIHLKDRVNEITTTNKRDLIERIVDVWFRNPEIAQLIAKYYASMPNRIVALIAAARTGRGWH